MIRTYVQTISHFLAFLMSSCTYVDTTEMTALHYRLNKSHRYALVMVVLLITSNTHRCVCACVCVCVCVCMSLYVCMHVCACITMYVCACMCKLF